MSKSVVELLEKNKQWAQKQVQENKEFFKKLAKEQKPKYFWLGCSDSRVSPSNILNLKPGEIFVYRNIANQFLKEDIGALSSLEFAIKVLKVEHIIICGHYGCGGIQAAIQGSDLNFLNHWVTDIKATFNEYKKKFPQKNITLNHMCELNVLKQFNTIIACDFIKNANVNIHQWIYNLNTGRLKNLKNHN